MELYKYCPVLGTRVTHEFSGLFINIPHRLCNLHYINRALTSSPWQLKPSSWQLQSSLASNTIVTGDRDDTVPNYHTIVTGELGNTIPNCHSVSKLCSCSKSCVAASWFRG